MVTELPESELRSAVATLLGGPVDPGPFTTEPVAYESGSPATGDLLRVRGTAADGRAWSVFVKVLQHARHWPRLDQVPAEVREWFVRDFPWRQELDAWEEPFAGRLPAGVRVPELYRLTELPDDRALLWMEDVDAVPDAEWTPELFARAAYALGGLAALRSTPEVLASTPLPPGFALRVYVDGRVRQAAVPVLSDDAAWRHPLLADVDDRLRADLLRLADALPTVLDRLDALPHALPHGDASPQNLLVPRGAPDEFVAIDISFQCPLAIGFDLGQLLVGLAHAGHLPAAALPGIHATLVPAFVAGMRDSGVDADPADVTYGYVGGLVARAAFTSLPYELLGAPVTDELRALFRQRAALCRFLADLGLELLDR
ncbi:hypothetical protein [Longispora urticae]